MRLGRRFIVWLPDLDGLVRLAADEPQAGLVKGGAEDTIFGVEGAWLGDGVHGLVAIARLPVLFPTTKEGLVSSTVSIDIRNGTEQSGTEWNRKDSVPRSSWSHCHRPRT